MPSSLNDLVRAWRERAERAATLADQRQKRVLGKPIGEVAMGELDNIAESCGISQAYLQAAQELEAALKGNDG